MGVLPGAVWGCLRAARPSRCFLPLVFASQPNVSGRRSHADEGIHGSLEGRSCNPDGRPVSELECSPPPIGSVNRVAAPNLRRKSGS